MSDNSTCLIEANPDVTGVGIRISVYALVLGGRILTYLIDLLAARDDSKDFRAAVESALTLQGLALLCTAIYQTAARQLSLFHAICCVHLLALLGVTIVSKNTYRGHGPWRTYTNIVISILAICAFVAFDAYIWATAPTFGNQPDCNASTIYVLVGVKLYATSDVFRYIALAAMAIIPAVFILIITCMAPCFLGLWYLHKRHPGTVTTWQTPQYQEPVEDTPYRKLANVVGLTGFSIYAIVSLEQTIMANNVNEEEKQWGFGQVLALFLLIGVANELLNLSLASMDKKQRPEKVPASAEEDEAIEMEDRRRPSV